MALLYFYLRVRFKTDFQAIATLAGDLRQKLDPKHPALLVANHMSWWDGFFLIHLQQQLWPETPHYSVMLESELRKFPFFRKIGAIGVEPTEPVRTAHVFSALKRLKIDLKPKKRRSLI